MEQIHLHYSGTNWRAIFSIKGSEIDVALVCGGRVGERVIKTVIGLVTKFEVDHIPGLFALIL